MPTPRENYIQDRVNVPSGRSSQEGNAVDPKIRAQSFFSARVAEAHVLDRIRQVSDDFSNGKISQGEARIALKNFVRENGLDDGSRAISNLGSTARLNLILRQNAAMARAAGRYERMNDPEVKRAFPFVIYQVLIIQPLRYRLSSKIRLLYREAAYLLCTDPELPPEQILQYYLWRWEIELNFKDEKSIFGIHQSQMRTQKSVDCFPGFVAAAYSLFLLTATCQQPQYPKWRTEKTIWRVSTNKLLADFRIDCLKNNKSGFTAGHTRNATPFLFHDLWENVIQAAMN